MPFGLRHRYACVGWKMRPWDSGAQEQRLATLVDRRNTQAMSRTIVTMRTSGSDNPARVVRQSVIRIV